jgi:hypothetical protein
MNKFFSEVVNILGIYGMVEIVFYPPEELSNGDFINPYYIATFIDNNLGFKGRNAKGRTQRQSLSNLYAQVSYIQAINELDMIYKQI